MNLDMSLAETIAKVTAGGITLFSACWIILQSLKREVPGLRKYLVRVVLAVALTFALTAYLVPVAFVILAAWLILAALILSVNEAIKRMAQKPPQ